MCAAFQRNSPTAGSYVALTFSSSLSHIVRNGLIAFELNFGRDHYCGFCVSKVFGFSPLGLTLFSSSLSEVLSPAGSDGFDASLQKYFRPTFLTIFLSSFNILSLSSQYFSHRSISYSATSWSWWFELATTLSEIFLWNFCDSTINRFFIYLNQIRMKEKSAWNIFHLKNSK